MLRCEYCIVNIDGEQSECPLCGGVLHGEKGEDSFPNIPTIYEEFNVLIRMMIFLSIVVTVVCIGINMIFYKESKWSLLVAAAVICMWLSLLLIIRKKDSIPKTIIWQVVLITILAVLWDYFMGWHRWSINYVLPSIFVGAMILMGVAGKILKIGVGDYIVYLLIDALFGFIPIIFLMIGDLDVTFPSIICVAFSVISVSALILFQGENMKLELNKRMHL